MTIPKELEAFLARLGDDARSKAHEHLEAVLALGLRVEVPVANPESGQRARLVSEVELLAAKFADPAADLNTLLFAWRGRADRADLWKVAPEPYRRLAHRLLKLGVPLMAVEVLTEARETFRDDVRLRQLLGLALARTGATESANEELAHLYAEGHTDEESIGLLARTHKDLARAAVDAAERRRHLERSFALYAEAYALHPDSYWTGINAASMATLLDDRVRARELARRVLEQCTALLATKGPHQDDRFWLLATLGEAALNLEEWTSAENWYHQAAGVSFHRFGDMNTTRRQARRLLEKLGHDRNLVDHTLPMPRVVVFVGHRLDAPDRPSPRFPLELEPHVKAAIRQKLVDLQGYVGFSPAASGSDTLFQETVLELQGEAHVILPYEPDAFAKDMVDTVHAGDWRRRYDEVLRRAARVVVTSRERMLSGDVSFEYAHQVLQGLSMVRAEELETEVVGVAVWDGKHGSVPGGTSTTVNLWKKLGIRTEIIDIKRLAADAGISIAASAVAPPSPGSVKRAAARGKSASRVMCMIFADAVHFSKLAEDQVPKFVEEFLGRTATLLKQYHDTAVVKNTWGDGLYIVFTNVRDAGLFALDLAQMASGTPWQDLGLPRTLNARIAVHAGPVSRCKDPVIERINYTGTHVSRAARIEPITPPGQVYASQAFAALASLERVPDFRCEFVKQAELAKNYGSFPTYVVRRRRRAAT